MCFLQNQLTEITQTGTAKITKSVTSEEVESLLLGAGILHKTLPCARQMEDKSLFCKTLQRTALAVFVITYTLCRSR